MDDWAALVASAIIILNTYFVFHPALGELLDEQNHDQLIDEVRVISEEVQGVIDTEKCFIRKFGMRYVVDIHVRVSANLTVAEGHKIGHNVQSSVQKKTFHKLNMYLHMLSQNERKFRFHILLLYFLIQVSYINTILNFKSNIQKAHFGYSYEYLLHFIQVILIVILIYSIRFQYTI